jgi:hypothetical protein
VEVGNYAQLRQAVGFLKEHGVTFIDSIPPELYPGIDYSAFALDPDGHCIQLYYYMEQIGWDGRVRPAARQRRMAAGTGTSVGHVCRPGVSRAAWLVAIPVQAGTHVSTIWAVVSTGPGLRRDGEGEGEEAA